MKPEPPTQLTCEFERVQPMDDKPLPEKRMAMSLRCRVALVAILIVIFAERLGLSPEQFMNNVLFVYGKLALIFGIAVTVIAADTKRPI